MVSRSRLSLHEYLNRRTLAGDLVGVTCSCRITEYREEIEAQSGMSAYAKLAPCRQAALNHLSQSNSVTCHST